MTQASGDKAPGRMRRRIGRVFMIVGATWTALLLIAAIVAIVLIARKPKVPDRTVLELRLDRSIAEAPNALSLTSLLKPNSANLPALLRALTEAARDPKIKGLLVYVGGRHGLATVQELRDAILQFRKSGKFALAFTPSFGELVGGTSNYYLATACDEIWLQPSGSLGITGLRAEVPFLKGLFDKVDVQVEGEKRKEFKNAFNTFTEAGFTEPHKRATEAMLGDIFDQVSADIATARKMDAQTVKDLFAKGPFLAEDALAKKLVDHVGYRDQVISAAKGRSGAETELLYAGEYLERAGHDDPEDGEGAKFAVIYGLGTVSSGRGSVDPLSGESTMGAETIAAALRAAGRDEDVKAVIFRIDSPGGSYVASDTIWREAVELRRGGKPLIVSMANVAASGGYFVALNATKIVAEPSTLTGSIGVYTMKFVTKDLWPKLGVAWGVLATSPNAALWSSLSKFNQDDQELVRRWLDFVYADFTGKVAQGRKLSPEAVEAVAQGRVWTGRQAKAHGLVDALGGMETAIKLAKQSAGINEDAPVKLVPFPERQGLLHTLLDDDSSSSEDETASEFTAPPLLQQAAAWAETLQRQGRAAGAANVQAQTPDVR